MFAYISSVLDFLPIQVNTEHWVEFPVLCSRFTLVIYFIHRSVYMWPGKEFTYQCRRPKRCRFNPQVGKIPWRRKWGNSIFSRQEYWSEYSCLENPMDKGAWRGTVQGVTKSWTRLTDHTRMVCICQSQSPNLSLPPYPLVMIFFLPNSVSLLLSHK